MSVFDINRVTIRTSAFESIIEVSCSVPWALSVFEWYRLGILKHLMDFLGFQRIKSD